MILFKPLPFTPKAGRPTIVVLEDDRPTAVMYHSFLDEEGYNTGIFDDNDACRRFVRENRTDLIILDVVNYTGECGLNLLETLQHDLGASLPPVIIATGLQGSNLYRHPALQRMRPRLFTKPFDITDMLKTVRLLLGKEQDKGH